MLAGRDPATGNGLSLTFAEGLVASVGDNGGDHWIAPGLVDLQVNGFGGIDLNDSAVTPDAVARLCRLMWQHGVTAWLPTIVTNSETSIIAALAAIAQARRADPRVAHSIPGIHVEGPFIAPNDGPRGAHPAAHVRAPDLVEVGRWQDACEGLVSMITLSPHWADAPAVIAALTAQGINVALGHTDATPAQIHAAADAGAVLSTHLGNGAAAMLPRHPNMIWAQLADDRLTAGFIADGHHLPPDTFRAMLRAKGPGRAFLVSDAVALGGMAPGLYDAPIGGRVELRADGWLGTPGTVYLAGAARPLCDDVAIAADMAGISLAEALALATTAPGRFAAGRGRLQPGLPGDAILFDWEPGARAFRVVETWVMGERVWQA